MLTFKTLKWTVQAPKGQPDNPCIGLITLNRPEALNAIDVRMRVELDLLLDQIRRDDRLEWIGVRHEEGAALAAAGDDRLDDAAQLRVFGVVDAEGAAEVSRADEDHVDAVDLEERVEGVDGGAGLDLDRE